MTPVRARWMPPGARPDPHRRSPGMASLASRARRAIFGIPGPSATSIWRRPSLLLGNVRDLSGGSDWSVRSAPNSGRERDSLIGAEISLIADLNSLQGRKKFPVRMRRELAHNVLI